MESRTGEDRCVQGGGGVMGVADEGGQGVCVCVCGYYSSMMTAINQTDIKRSG